MSKSKRNMMTPSDRKWSEWQDDIRIKRGRIAARAKGAAVTRLPMAYLMGMVRMKPTTKAA